MTLKEFYAAVGGDYDATLNRIPKESMVLRFVKKYADDKTYAQLTEAVKAQDWETAFRASHTLKGVAQNLGFDGLYRAAFALTEEMRGGKPLTDTALYDAVTTALTRLWSSGATAHSAAAKIWRRRGFPVWGFRAPSTTISPAAITPSVMIRP